MKRYAVAAALAFALPFAGSAVAKDKEGPTLRYAHTYAEAVTEARDRNALIFATFHKDN